MPKLFKKRLVLSKEESRDGWFSRGYLPHFDGEGVTQHVCFHLFDSLPQHVMDKWREELKSIPDKEPRLRGERGSRIFSIVVMANVSCRTTGWRKLWRTRCCISTENGMRCTPGV